MTATELRSVLPVQYYEYNLTNTLYSDNVLFVLFCFVHRLKEKNNMVEFFYYYTLVYMSAIHSFAGLLTTSSSKYAMSKHKQNKHWQEHLPGIEHTRPDTT